MSDKISKIKQKTLVLWWKNDEILPLENAYKFEKSIPNVKLVVIDNCGHVPHLETPIIAANEILSFLDEKN